MQLNLETEGLRYRKWGHEQFAKPGDWLVDNGGDVFTVGTETFINTYREISRGAFVKSTLVWAECADSDGVVVTNEGQTAYRAGDWLVSNREDGADAYAIGAAKFEAMYEPDE